MQNYKNHFLKKSKKNILLNFRKFMIELEFHTVRLPIS